MAELVYYCGTMDSGKSTLALQTAHNQKSRGRSGLIFTNKTKRRFLPNLQYRRFWMETENRWVRLRVTNAALRLIDKVGIEQVVADLRAKGAL